MPSSTNRTHALPDGTPGYETQDANARGVFAFLIGLGVVITAVVFFCWGIFRLYSSIYAHSTPASPFANERQLPSGPNLQVRPAEDFKAYMQREDQALNSYGWIDRQSGIVRVPIDRAMDMLVQKGLPVAPQAAEPGASSASPGKPSSPKTQPANRQKGVSP